MRVLVACEFSGIVRDAFSALGHDAWSCDLLQSERPGQHIQGDVTEELRKRWDLVVAHPPCTYLSYAGTAHWNSPGRDKLREAAMEFFMLCYNANSPRVCVENPFGLPHVRFRPANQIVNPWDFGEPIQKRTCLWLRGLPLLWRRDTLFGNDRTPQPAPPPEPIYVGTRIATGKPKKRYDTDCAGRKMQRRWHRTKAISRATDEERRHERSRFFVSIANAMAEQWGGKVEALCST